MSMEIPVKPGRFLPLLLIVVLSPSLHAALAYRDFVREAVRRCVLDWTEFRPENVMAMAVEAGIPDADREQVVNYIGQEFRGLHEGNAIRYRLRGEDIAAIRRE